MASLLDKLRSDYPAYQFTEGEASCWSASERSVTYAKLESETDVWSLLHELGHALLDHRTFTSDLDLLYKESAAWEKAVHIAEHYGVAINSDYIQDCLDTYRDWLHKRSTCPICSTKSLPSSDSHYLCFNCHATWKVSGTARHSRPYRLSTEKLPGPQSGQFSSTKWP